jgi:RND family efflux transporter MFP subunit
MDTQNTNQSAGAAAEAAHNTAAQPRSWKSWIAALLLTAAVATFALSVWKPEIFKAAAPATKTQAQTEEYYCPMHPQQRSDKPGNCPICSMKLVRMNKTPQAGAMPAAAPGEAAGPSTIFITPERQQLIGVQSVPAAFRPLAKEIRTLGKVAFDETKITHIHTKVAGFIEDVFADFLGKPVKQGDPLFTLYSPELVATQQEYLLALRSASILKDSSFPWISAGSKNLLEAARRRLRLWDVTEEEIQQLEREGQPKRALTIFSPVSGVVTERAAYHHGKYVTPETDLYTIVDLSTVWVLGEVYESELPYIKLGQTVQVEFPYTGGMTERSGKIVFLQPTLDAATRTAQVRLEFSNPDLLLRPGMFVHFRARIPLGAKLAVPQDAVLDTGAEQYVFVDLGQGYFEPRPVKLGPEAGGYYAVERGLKAGERVVTSANFILDSESRLKSAFANMGLPPAGRPAPRTPTPGSTSKSGSQ